MFTESKYKLFRSAYNGETKIYKTSHSAGLTSIKWKQSFLFLSFKNKIYVDWLFLDKFTDYLVTWNLFNQVFSIWSISRINFQFHADWYYFNILAVWQSFIWVRINISSSERTRVTQYWQNYTSVYLCLLSLFCYHKNKNGDMNKYRQPMN